MKWPFRIAAAVMGLLLIIGAIVVMRPTPVGVDVAQVVRAPFEQQVIEDGQTRVRERYTISAPVVGALTRITLEEGDTVSPGSVVAHVLPLPSPLLDARSRQVAEEQVASAVEADRQAQAAVTHAETVNALAQRKLERFSVLAAKGAIAPAQLDSTTVNAHVSESDLAAARFAEQVAAHTIEEARAALETFSPTHQTSEHFEVTSPIRGRVLHVLHKNEGTVATGTPLIEVGDPRALELVVDVLSQDAVDIRPGMLARVEHWGGEVTLNARVRRVEPAAFTHTSALGVDEQRVNIILDLDNPPAPAQALGDGFAVEVEITIWSKPDVIQIPTSALFRQGSDWAAFVVESRRVTVRRVQVGHRGPLQAEIIRGLQPGEQVIIHPGADVREGVTVTSR